MRDSNFYFYFFFADNLKYNVAKSLPQEIDLSRMNRWDAVLVNQYLCELREAKKQGRKERRHKEAQAVLAAATAAAAASSRTSSFRKDAFDETTHQEVSNFSVSELVCIYIFSVAVNYLLTRVLFPEHDEVEYLQWEVWQ